MFTKRATLTNLQPAILSAHTKMAEAISGFDFEPDPSGGYLYVTSRALTSDVPNLNYDMFPHEEMKTAYKTFIGCPVYVDHHNTDDTRARGVILDAKYHDEDPEDRWTEILMELDEQTFPKLCQLVRDGEIDTMSMGCTVLSSQCSVCGNEAEDFSDFCTHINQKGTTFDGQLAYEICHGIEFIEESFVYEPADPNAQVSDVNANYLEKAAKMSKAAIMGKIAEPWNNSIEIRDPASPIVPVAREIAAVTWSYMTDSLGFGDEATDYFSVYPIDNGNVLNIQVNAELDFDEMFGLTDVLNQVVTKYDEDAYFDMVAPGIIECVFVADVLQAGKQGQIDRNNTPLQRGDIIDGPDGVYVLDERDEYGFYAFEYGEPDGEKWYLHDEDLTDYVKIDEWEGAPYFAKKASHYDFSESWYEYNPGEWSCNVGVDLDDQASMGGTVQLNEDETYFIATAEWRGEVVDEQLFSSEEEAKKWVENFVEDNLDDLAKSIAESCFNHPSEIMDYSIEEIENAAPPLYAHDGIHLELAQRISEALLNLYRDMTHISCKEEGTKKADWIDKHFYPRVATRNFTYAEQQFLQDESLGDMARNRDKLKNVSDDGADVSAMFI